MSTWWATTEDVESLFQRLDAIKAKQETIEAHNYFVRAELQRIEAQTSSKMEEGTSTVLTQLRALTQIC